MNPLRRVVAQTVRQSTAKRIVLCLTSPFNHQYCTEVEQSAWKAIDWPRPSEIPFQAKVANSVNLIGYVDSPIQFETSPDGKDWAGTVIIQKAYTVPLWIPVLFEGDLAHIAFSHLKKDDHVHIAGQLTADPPAVDGIEGQANVQVMVHSLNFIEPLSQMGKSFTSGKQEVTAIDFSASKKKGTNAALSAWHDLLDHPEQWQDCRSDKLKGLVKTNYPDFRRKDGTLALWLNRAPDWALSKLGVVSEVQTYESTNVKQSEGVKTDKYNNEKQYKASKKKGTNAALRAWYDLLDHPEQWQDCRSDKLKGLVKTNYPDFRRKDGTLALWLNRAPDWALSKLGVVSEVQTYESTNVKQSEGVKTDKYNNEKQYKGVKTNKYNNEKQYKGDEFWSDLLKNPNKWWDNRSDKRGEKHPDFKHKETGKALWLTDAPAWVKSELPPVKNKQKTDSGKRDALLS